MKKIFISTMVILGTLVIAQDKPNILWLTCEDMTDFYLSCYGNQVIQTPNLDSFAARGIKFTHAFSNGAQCSPARNTLVTGCYAPSVGADWHRADRALPLENYWTPLLTKAGYYCASIGKMVDFNANNTTPNDLWHDGKSYKNAPANTPWFSILNFYDTHMSSITKNPIGNRKNRTIANEDVEIPPYVPDIDSIRDDLAWHMEFVKKLDVWFGNQLDELETSGHADNTIIFFFSDHGGSLPNSKGYLNNGGTKVPLLVYFPAKWAHLAPVQQPAVIENLVSFVDFGPTVLSLAGIETPEQLQGQAFMGEYAQNYREFIYLYKANQALNYIPSRGITNGKIKLIWNYKTAFPAGSRQDFQWKMPGYRGWEQAFRNGELNDPHNNFWEPQQAFELYNLTIDPYEGNNLAYNPAWADTLVKYKAILQQTIRTNKDLGFFPKSMRNYTDTEFIFYDWVRETNYDLNSVISAAEFASDVSAFDIDSLETLLKNPDAAVRFWASMGFFKLARLGEISMLPELITLMFQNELENVETRANCAAALIYTGNFCEPLDFLVELLEKKTETGRSYMQSIQNNASPVAERILNFTLNNSGFYNRSALINTGTIPYSLLLKGNIKAAVDSSVFSSDTLRNECTFKKKECGEQVLFEDFNNNLLPIGWDEFNSTGKLNVANGKLEIDYENTHPLITKSFDQQSGNIDISFIFNSERNWFRMPVSFFNETGDTIVKIILGNNGNKAIELVTSSGNINVLGGVFTKNTDYLISTAINTQNDMVSLNVDGLTKPEAMNVPLLSETSSVSSVSFYFDYMYNQSKKVFIDNFKINTLVDKGNLPLTINAAWDSLNSATIGSGDGDYPQQAWDELLQVYYQKLPINNSCTLTTEVYKNAALDLDSAISNFYKQKIKLAGFMDNEIVSNSITFPGIYNPQKGLFEPISKPTTGETILSIYSISGTKIFESQDPNHSWNGTMNGRPVQKGIYIWRMISISENKKTTLHSGKFVLHY